MNLQNEQVTAIIKWAGALAELRDDATGKHNDRLQMYLKSLINEAKKEGIKKVSQWDADDVALASVLHDVGKIKIHDSILLKKGRLTQKEFEQMKKHCEYGKALIENLEDQVLAVGIPPDTEMPHIKQFFEYAKTMAYYHHEKWDGTGYPDGLKGEAIPLEARMMALVDVYDVLISERPYKPSFPHDQAMEMILEERGTHFDPKLVDLFAKLNAG